MRFKVGVVTLSDRASLGVYEDKSAEVIKQILSQWVVTETEFDYRLIADEFEVATKTLKELSQTCHLILTTGGTGPAARDITPEATQAVCQKILPGFGELMRAESLKFVPTAILSRQTAGICQTCLIINLPGQPKAIKECLEPVFPAVPYCIELVSGMIVRTDESKMRAFRPKSAPKID